MKKRIQLVPLVFDHESLQNPYSVLTVGSEEISRANAKVTQRFADYLISESCQEKIGQFEVDGSPLFIPSRSSVKQKK